MNAKKLGRLLLLAGVALATSVLDQGLAVRDAHAIIGRPLTPMSYAGVARRTTRRTAAVAVGTAAVAAPYAAPPYGYW
jgi:hypothetical protein